MEDNFLALSALQHYAYCPRQFALIHVEHAWDENRFTAEGRVLHERIDSGVAEQRRGMRYERGVSLLSHRYQLTGKMDLLEVEQSIPTRYFPVEYKRGKPKTEDWDRIQLCAQALCLEEMLDVRVDEGAIWYWESRQRDSVCFNDDLREITIAVIHNAHHLLITEKTPSPIQNVKSCRSCSLADLCGPDTFRSDHSADYVIEMFRQ